MRTFIRMFHFINPIAILSTFLMVIQCGGIRTQLYHVIYSYTLCIKLNSDRFQIDKSSILNRAAGDWGWVLGIYREGVEKYSPERAPVLP